MILNNLVFVINAKLEFVDGTTRQGHLTANSINRDIFYVISPATEDTEIRANFKNYKQGESGNSVFFKLSEKRVDELIDKNDNSIPYELVKDWNVFQSFSPNKTLKFISANRAGEIGVSFNFSNKLVPNIPSGVVYKGELYNVGELDGNGAYVVKTTLLEYEANKYANYNDLLILNNGNFILKRSIKQSNGTLPLYYKVDPNIANEDYQEVDFELVSELISVVGDLAGNVLNNTNIYENLNQRVSDIENIDLPNLDDVKVDKQISSDDVERAYTHKNGVELAVPLENGIVPNSLVKLDSNGDFEVNTPTKNNNPANKGFVEIEISNAEDRVDLKLVDKVDKELGHRLISPEEISKVGKILTDGIGNKSFMDDGTYKVVVSIEEYEGLITQLEILRNAFTFIGDIELTTENITQQALTNRALDLMGDLKTGYVLSDENDVEWYYNGDKMLWNDMGQGKISKASYIVDGLMSKELFKKLNDLKVNNISVDTNGNVRLYGNDITFNNAQREEIDNKNIEEVMLEVIDNKSSKNELREVGVTKILRNHKDEVVKVESDNVETEVVRNANGDLLYILEKYNDNQKFKTTLIRKENKVVKIEKEKVN